MIHEARPCETMWQNVTNVTFTNKYNKYNKYNKCDSWQGCARAKVAQRGQGQLGKGKGGLWLCESLSGVMRKAEGSWARWGRLGEGEGSWARVVVEQGWAMTVWEWQSGRGARQGQHEQLDKGKVMAARGWGIGFKGWLWRLTFNWWKYTWQKKMGWRMSRVQVDICRARDWLHMGEWLATRVGDWLHEREGEGLATQMWGQRTGFMNAKD